jgi:hypothetical protein
MSKRAAILTTSVLVLALYGCKKTEDATQSLQIKQVTQSENQIIALADKFSELAKFMQTRGESSGVFSDSFLYSGIKTFQLDQLTGKANAGKNATAENELMVHLDLTILPAPESVQIPPSQIWKNVFEGCRVGSETCFLESGSFGILSGRFQNTSTFVVETLYEARMLRGELPPLGIKAYQTLELVEATTDDWRINKWTQDKLSIISPAQQKPLTNPQTFLFQDVTSTAIPDTETLQRVQSSSHQELLVKHANTKSYELKDVSFRYKHYNDWESAYQYPGVSVVDFDGDGFDDLFITDRWQPAQLLRNQGDETFVDVTEASGLNVDQVATCALFADFDNDGDPDAFVCRTLESCLYFENKEGKFHLDDTFTDRHMKFVVSGSVVDINNDGLLDLYLNTYGFSSDDSVWQTETYRKQDRQEMQDRVQNQHWFLNRGGASNIVLMNQNGKLKRVEVGDELAQWRNSYQTAWSDFDADGDLDIYICNDFSPDYFLRNDTPRGSFSLEFTDVTSEVTASNIMGFGMGASWGDYNNDGLLDLYVSNIYSKAGNRIIKQIDDVHPKIKVASQGNFLYKNLGGKFKQVAGLKKDDQQVSKVGWSFGGQFADFDNDGLLDLYVPSGYYTPDKAIQTSGDL